MSELASNPTTPTKKDGVKTISLTTILWGSLIIFILFITFFAWQKKSDEPEKPEQKETSGGQKKSTDELTFVEVINYTEPLNVTDQYGEKIDIGPGEFLSFDSTEDYCVKDGNGKEYCETKGNDVGKKMPITNANRTLFFKLTNAKKGIVYIVHWKRIYK